MRIAQATKSLSFTEFVTLMALMMALVALSTDAMLPALPEIGSELGIRQVNDSQLMLSLLFLGMGVGQIFYGPVLSLIGGFARLCFVAIFVMRWAEAGRNSNATASKVLGPN